LKLDLSASLDDPGKQAAAEKELFRRRDWEGRKEGLAL